jgi:hypothetical protein
MAAGAQQEKEEPNLDEGSGLPQNTNRFAHQQLPREPPQVGEGAEEAEPAPGGDHE